MWSRERGQNHMWMSLHLRRLYLICYGFRWKITFFTVIFKSLIRVLRMRKLSPSPSPHNRKRLSLPRSLPLNRWLSSTTKFSQFWKFQGMFLAITPQLYVLFQPPYSFKLWLGSNTKHFGLTEADWSRDEIMKGGRDKFRWSFFFFFCMCVQKKTENNVKSPNQEET